MMTLMTQGIMAGNPKLQAAVHQTATIMASGMAPQRNQAIPYCLQQHCRGNYYGDIIIHAPAGMNIQQLADEIECRQNRKYRSGALMGNPARGIRNS